MWFDGWADVARVLVIGAAAYATLVLMLRVSGKRTLAKLNAFDLVVTVAVGSTLATILLSSDVSYTEGAAALALLVALQFAAALISAHTRIGRMALKSTPTLLLSNGRFREEALRRQRVSADEVRQAVRSSGSGDVAGVAAVVLETDGSLSVISTEQAGDGSAMAGVDGASAVSGHGRWVRDRKAPTDNPTDKEEPMSVAGRMLETYPEDLGGTDRGKLAACIDACVECAQACTACADACLSEESVAQLTKCIRTNSDCADICSATARVLSRHTGYDANLTADVLRSCVTACRTCADECGSHAEHHEHCRVCAEVCRQCERACEELLGALG